MTIICEKCQAEIVIHSDVIKPKKVICPCRRNDWVKKMNRGDKFIKKLKRIAKKTTKKPTKKSIKKTTKKPIKKITKKTPKRRKK